MPMLLLGLSSLLVGVLLVFLLSYLCKTIDDKDKQIIELKKEINDKS